jgi:hypothetical protein
LPIQFYFTHDLPIPACFNQPLQRALDDKHEYIAIVEEDMVIPADAIGKLGGAIMAGNDIAYYDYRLDNGLMASARIADVDISGTGAIMFKASALRRLIPLRSGQEYDAKTFEPLTKLSEAEGLKRYGQHDIDLFKRAKDLGLKTKCVGSARHLKVRDYNTEAINDGCHTIEALV